MQNHQDIQNLANRRLEEAKLLLQNNFCEGALYLAGYCIELLLKARIVKILDIPNLFDDNFSPKEFRKPFFTHDLKYLLLFAGLKEKLARENANNPQLFQNWSLIEETWNEHCRYKQCGNYAKKDVQKFIEAIENPTIGLQQWINRQ